MYFWLVVGRPRRRGDRKGGASDYASPGRPAVPPACRHSNGIWLRPSAVCGICVVPWGVRLCGILATPLADYSLVKTLALLKLEALATSLLTL